MGFQWLPVSVASRSPLMVFGILPLTNFLSPSINRSVCLWFPLLVVSLMPLLCLFNLLTLNSSVEADSSVRVRHL